jgi:hypothetical protein
MSRIALAILLIAVNMMNVVATNLDVQTLPYDIYGANDTAWERFFYYQDNFLAGRSYIDGGYTMFPVTRIVNTDTGNIALNRSWKNPVAIHIHGEYHEKGYMYGGHWTNATWTIVDPIPSHN